MVRVSSSVGMCEPMMRGVRRGGPWRAKYAPMEKETVAMRRKEKVRRMRDWGWLWTTTRVRGLRRRVRGGGGKGTCRVGLTLGVGLVSDLSP